MAILKIARMGHPVLLRPADPVVDPGAREIARLIEDMLDTMADADGVGLAAPQVHVPLRVVLFHLPPERAEAEGEAEAQALTVLINPEIEPLDDAKDLGWEACLSVPGLAGEVPRFRRIRYSGVLPSGERLERVAEGFHARVVQHECDHLEGMLFPRRMTDLSTLGFAEEINRYHGRGGAGGRDAAPTD